MSHTVLYWLASIAFVVTSACSGSDAQDNATFTLHLTEQRVNGPSTELMDSFEQSKEQTLEASRGTEPRLRVAADAEPGVSVAIDEPPAVGTADEGRVEVTLDVDRFFSGTLF